MRVPIPVVLLLVLAVVGGVWWSNTRKLDFLAAPSAARLEEIRIKVESSLPRADPRDEEVPAPPVVQAPEPPPPVPEPEIDLGDLTTPPTLQNYAELAPQGPAHLIELATGLEKKGEYLRALLAWERVLDRTQADPTQVANAISAITRLRPTLPDWNAKPEAKIQITLHAGTGKKLSKMLTPILDGVARDLESASSGIVKVTAMVSIGKTGTSAKGPTPVALWLAGPDKKSATTDVLSFTVDSPDALRQDILKTVFQLVRSHVSRDTAFTPPATLADGEDAQAALRFRVTRLCWREFASTLNLTAKKAK